jgi:hypothetical protein
VAAAPGTVSVPVSRLQLSRQEIDGVLDDGYAAQHPEVVAAVMQSAASDFAACMVAKALQDVADALLTTEESPANGPGLVRAQALVRP